MYTSACLVKYKWVCSGLCCEARLCRTWKLLPAVIPLLLILPRSSVMISDMPVVSCCVTSSRYSLAVSIVSKTCTCLSKTYCPSLIQHALQSMSAHARRDAVQPLRNNKR